MLRLSPSQGIAGAIDRFGQAFGPVIGGSMIDILGEAALMRSTGMGLAVISTICLMFIGDGCASWLREACCHASRQGYTQVGASDAPDGAEMEMAEEGEAELSPGTKFDALNSHANGHVVDGLPLNGHTGGLNGDTNGHACPKVAQPASVKG